MPSQDTKRHSPNPDTSATPAAPDHATPRAWHPPAPRRPVDRARLDLRRRAAREQAARLLDLASDLDPSDAALLRAILDDGMTIRSLAALLRVNPRSLHKRARRLFDRLCEPMVRFVIAHRGRWPSERRAFATCVFIEGVSLRDAATRLKISLHAARRHSERVRALFESISF